MEKVIQKLLLAYIFEQIKEHWSYFVTFFNWKVSQLSHLFAGQKDKSAGRTLSKADAIISDPTNVFHSIFWLQSEFWRHANEMFECVCNFINLQMSFDRQNIFD